MNEKPTAELTRGELVEFVERLAVERDLLRERLESTRAERDDIEGKLAVVQTRLSAVMSMHKALEHVVLAILKLEKSP